MSQTRLFLVAARADAATIFEVLERAFEDDGYPLALVELDEERDLQEVSLYIDENAGDAAARITQALGKGPQPEILIERLPDIDWVAKSLEGLKPVRAGCFLVHGSHDRGQCDPDDIGIEIEAGQAFGTGHHATTSSCLELIADVIAKELPANALDLGAGSAVLAIAIAKLAGIPVLAVDIDPVAVEVAIGNIRLNGVAGLVDAVAAPGFDHPAIVGRGGFDLIVANILAGPLIELAPDMARHVSRGASLILSGILERQGDAVLQAYARSGFQHLRTLLRDGWVTLHLKG